MFIGELSKRSGLSKDGIRHYESLGLLHSFPVRAGTRIYRKYDETSLERLSLISMAKRLNFSLKELVEPLDRIIDGTMTREERAQFLARKVMEINVEIQRLREARDELVAAVATPDKEYADQRLKELGLWLE